MTCHRCGPFGVCFCAQFIELADAPPPEPDSDGAEVYYLPGTEPDDPSVPRAEAL